jgi:long-chain acyl-CoA synthetase
MDIFENLANSHFSNSAIITDDNVNITYGDLKKISVFFKNKIPQRSLVFSLNKNSVGSLCGYISFLKNKVVPLLLDVKIDFELLLKLKTIYRPNYIWLPTEDIVKFSDGKVVYNLYDYSLIEFEKEGLLNLNDELALLLTTSGSTGSPKLVRISYDNIKSNALSIIEYLSIDCNERPITTLPMSYSFGLSIINSHLYSGATILLTNLSLFEKEFWTFFKIQKATSLSGVPYVFEMLKRLRFTKMDLPNLSTLTQAGGKMNIDLNREFSEFCQNNNKKLFIMYGQTEATARMSYLPYEKSLEKLGSIGIAIPSGKFSLIDSKGQIITQSNIEGELVYEGGNVTLGYAECLEDLSKSDENNGKLLTGDIAKRDLDGYYYLVGRKKRFVKIFGNRINLDELESLIKNIISECACVGNDDKIYVYLIDESRIEEVSNFVSQKTSINSSAFSIRFIDSIPKNSSGKTNYAALKFE